MIAWHYIMIYRLKTERDRLKLQVREQHDLNASLKQEMVIYNSIGLDDVHRNTGPGRNLPSLLP